MDVSTPTSRVCSFQTVVFSAVIQPRSPPSGHESKTVSSTTIARLVQAGKRERVDTNHTQGCENLYAQTHSHGSNQDGPLNARGIPNPRGTPESPESLESPESRTLRCWSTHACIFRIYLACSHWVWHAFEPWSRWRLACVYVCLCRTYVCLCVRLCVSMRDLQVHLLLLYR